MVMVRGANANMRALDSVMDATMLAVGFACRTGMFGEVVVRIAIQDGVIQVLGSSVSTTIRVRCRERDPGCLVDISSPPG